MSSKYIIICFNLNRISFCTFIKPDITEAQALMEYGRTLVPDTPGGYGQTMDSNKDPESLYLTYNYWYHNCKHF